MWPRSAATPGVLATSYRESSPTRGEVLRSMDRGWPIPPEAPSTATLACRVGEQEGAQNGCTDTYLLSFPRTRRMHAAARSFLSGRFWCTFRSLPLHTIARMRTGVPGPDNKTYSSGRRWGRHGRKDVVSDVGQPFCSLIHLDSNKCGIRYQPQATHLPQEGATKN